MLIKKVISVVLLVFFFSFSALSAPFPDVSARGAVLMNAETKEVIFEKNMNERLSMASTTKIMTSLLAIESGRLNCTVTAKKDVLCEGTAIGIKKGDTFTLETLVYAMLLESGNDSAILTAEYLAGDEESFSVMMNEKAKEIGMTSTNFVTSSGLDDKEHYTTAYDMALLGAYAVENPIFKKICSTKTYSAKYIKPEISATYSNHNRLLRSYGGVFGVKTGFTKKSGRCLVSACERDGVTLIAVTLNAGDDWNDHMKMYDYGYSVVSQKSFDCTIPDEINVYGGDKEKIQIGMSGIRTSADEEDEITYKARLRKWLYAPIKKDDIVGYVDIFVNGEFIKSAEIKALEGAELTGTETKPNFSFLYKLKQIFTF